LQLFYNLLNLGFVKKTIDLDVETKTAPDLMVQNLIYFCQEDIIVY